MEIAQSVQFRELLPHSLIFGPNELRRQAFSNGAFILGETCSKNCYEQA